MDLAALLRTHRSQERWDWELLDNQDNFMGSFSGVTAGSLKANIAAPIRSGGSLTWKGKEEPDWISMRVRPVYHARRIDGTIIEWPYGVYIPSTPVPTWNGLYLSADVELYDKTLVLKEDAVDATFVLPAGTVVTTAIRDIILGTGETKQSIVDSTATLVNAMTWPTGTPKLTIVNELLDTINYFSLFCDDAGWYRAEPYVPTEGRGVMWDFHDGEGSLVRPNWKHTKDYFGKPNKVILTSQGSGDVPAMTATATNTDVTDPLGYGGKRGSRWVTVTEEGVEATSQAVLNDLAQRRLKSLADVSSTFEIEVGLVPLALNGLVTFKNAAQKVDVRAVLQEMEIPIQRGKATLVKAMIREVKG
jgi:hypothetical protein